MASMARILVVDDDALPRKFVVDCLAFAGHQAEEAVRAEEALATLESSTFDLVITDIRLPTMSGVDFVRRLGEDRPGLPVVAITGDVSKDLKYELAEAGLQALLQKPFSCAQLQAEIRRCLAEE
jgi:CheY-like chemotaxis protein